MQFDEPTPGPDEQRAKRRLSRVSKKTVLLVLLAPVLVLVWIPVLTGSSKSTAPKVQPKPAVAAGPAELGNAASTAQFMAPAPMGETAAGIQPVASAPLTLGVLKRDATDAIRHVAPRWKDRRDPFGSGDPVAEVQTEPRDLTWSPTSILLSQGLPPIAVINGRSYRTGDRVGSVFIVKIEERRVTYRDGDRLFSAELAIPQIEAPRD